ncbi:girdin [Nilaparvata lugens]|uniref:girdin n=1 Tax=Nilaparvata lugens TaxID=108931 RepID=UPI00193D0F12|nr:girdin [Nilaparvata lugens]
MNENKKFYGETNDVCGSKFAVDSVSKSNSESLRTIRELNTVFANRLKDCEDADGEKVSEEKVKILQQWVDNLTEQNVLLIEVVETFESEAVHQLKVGFESQKLQNKELQVLQQQMSFKNRIIEAQQKALEKLNVPVKKLDENGNTENNHTTSSVNGDVSSQNQESRIPNSMEPSSDSGKAYKACLSELESTKEKLLNVEKEKEVLRRSVDEAEKKIDKLNQMMISNEKNAREMRAALTAEVADKHDTCQALRRDAQQLEERLRQADMQTHFKDDIIKELRKQIKIATNKLVGQLRDKDSAVASLEEKLKVLKELPIEVSAQLYHLKQRVASLSELLAAAKRSQPKNDVQLVLNSILFNLNEALLLVDGYRCDGGMSTLKPDDSNSRHHKSSSNISDQSHNQMPLSNLMNELQSFKKLLEDDKLGCKKIDDEIRTILGSVSCSNQNEGKEMMETLNYTLEPLEAYFSRRIDSQDDKQNLSMKNLLESVRCIKSVIRKFSNKPESASINNELQSRISTLQRHLNQYQESKEKVYHKLCCLQNDQNEKVTKQPTESNCDVRKCEEYNQSGTNNIQCETSRDATIRQLTNDLQELNCQLKSREQIITNQQETIDLLQNSLQMEQTEMETLKVEKEKADAQTHALKAKVLLLEAELKEVQAALTNNCCVEATGFGAGKALNSTSSKTWTPWSGKQTLPTHRHIHDV